MPQPTTTLSQVATDLTNLFKGLSPTAIGNIKFDRCPVDSDLRTWCSRAGAAVFRRFEIVRPDGRAEPGILDASATMFDRDLELAVAYPRKLPRLYDQVAQGVQAIEDVIEADASLLSVTLWNSDNLGTGVLKQAPEVLGTDKSFDDVWFLSLLIHVRWFEATDII